MPKNQHKICKKNVLKVASKSGINIKPEQTFVYDQSSQINLERRLGDQV